jgi:serine phosphatase RsbU (regulator of sigma subunit)
MSQRQVVDNMLDELIYELRYDQRLEGQRNAERIAWFIEQAERAKTALAALDAFTPKEKGYNEELRLQRLEDERIRAKYRRGAV